MESSPQQVTEETKPLSTFLRLLAALVFPVLFELRNDPRVKNTPKVKLLVSRLDISEDRYS